MAAIAPEVQRAFTGGELDPELLARADLARFKTCLQTCENAVPLIRGVVTRRSGFLDIWPARDAYSDLHPFAFSDSDAYACEFAVGKLRFFRDYGVLQSAPGVPYEINTPLTQAEIPNICSTQSANALYITTGARTVQKLMRNDTLNWTIADAALRLGPFRDQNTDQTITVTASAVDLTAGTNFNLTASSAIFNAGQVGSLIRLEAKDQSQFGKWAGPGDAGFVANTSKVYWGDNFYKCVAVQGKSGASPPIHLVGAEWDGSTPAGDNAVKWLYLHSGFGVAKITGFTDSTHVACQAVTYVPDEINLAGTWRWSEAAFSDYRGWPKFCAIHKTRLYLMSTASDPTGGWASRIDDYTDFDATQTGDGDDTAAFRFRLEGDSGKVNLPRWLLSAARLGIGTAGDEHVLIPVTQGAIAPANFEVIPATTEGSAPVRAVRVEGIVFVAADTERVLEMADDPNTVQQNSFIANDLTLFASHIGLAGFTDLVWQREPYRLLWTIDANGALASCTYRKDQSVQAWARHPMTKGTVQTICTVPSPIKKRQDLWAIVSRPLASGTVRRIECLAPFFQKGDRDIVDAVFMDGAVQYSGIPTAALAVDARWNGETVNILADGKVVAPQVVNGSHITLPRAAASITYGLPLTGFIRTVRCDKDALGGALSGKNVRAQSAVVDVIDTAGVEVAAGAGSFEYLKPTGGQNMDAPPTLYSGPMEAVPLEADWSDSDIALRMVKPLPATIRAITPHYQVAR